MAIFYNFLTNENALMAQVGSKRKLRPSEKLSETGFESFRDANPPLVKSNKFSDNCFASQRGDLVWR
jgi:hypothetical protein